MCTIDNELKIELKKVETIITEMLKSENKNMQNVINWVIKSRGKMLRSQLLILSSKFGNSDIDINEYAAIIEIAHMASLVHDDIVDDADTRRGLLSVQKKFGKKMAVYSGDYMIFSALASNHIMYDNKFRRYLDCLKRICYGELGQYSMIYNLDITEEKYIENISGKTAVLFELSCSLGCFAADGDKDIINNLETFGKCYGIMFQLRDDLLDYKSSFLSIGKPVFQDFENGIYTLPVIYSAMNPFLKKKIIKIKDNIKNGKMSYEDCLQLKDIINQSGGFKLCIEKARYYYKKACGALNSLPKQKETIYLKNMLDTLMNLIVNVVD